MDQIIFSHGNDSPQPKAEQNTIMISPKLYNSFLETGYITSHLIVKSSFVDYDQIELPHTVSIQAYLTATDKLAINQQKIAINRQLQYTNQESVSNNWNSLGLAPFFSCEIKPLQYSHAFLNDKYFPGNYSHTWLEKSSSSSSSSSSWMSTEQETPNPASKLGSRQSQTDSSRQHTYEGEGRGASKM